jgi:hypothetical protein
METISVDVRRAVGAVDHDLEADLQRARILANWLDARFEFMGIRFGLDALIGLIPVVGDTLTSLASAYLILIAQRHDLGKVVQARMAVNILVDWLPGLVPLVGDAIDVAYKANLKNLKLLEAAAEKKRRRESGR